MTVYSRWEEVSDLCVHQWFISDFASNSKFISARIPGNWRITCGHCRKAIAGCCGHEGESTEVVWRQARGAWFGAFEVNEESHVVVAAKLRDVVDVPDELVKP